MIVDMALGSALFGSNVSHAPLLVPSISILVSVSRPDEDASVP